MIQRINTERHQNLLQKGIQKFSNSNMRQAEKYFLLSLQSNPISYTSYLNLNSLYRENSSLQKSILMCDMAIKLKPYTPEAYFHRSLNLMKMGKIQEALIDINCALSCENLIKFKRKDSPALLRNAILYSYNNLQAIGFMKWVNNEEYQKFSTVYEQNLKKGYKLKDKQKFYNIIELDNFRLLSENYDKNKDFTEQLKNKICEYLNFSNQRVDPQYNIQTPKKQTLNNKILKIRRINQESQQNYENIKAKERSLKKDSRKMNLHRRVCSGQIMTSRILQTQQKKKCHQLNHDRLSKKCQKCCWDKENEIPFQRKGIKVQMTTVQIYRGVVSKPKPYCIIKYEGDQKTTCIDYRGGQFPKWNEVFCFELNEKEDKKKMRVEIWNWQNNKQDKLIGQGCFYPKTGRIKCELTTGGKPTSYVFLQNTKI